MLAPRSPLIIAMTPFATGASAADGLPDAAKMLVDVAEKGALDHLLSAHGGHPCEHGADLGELGIGKATHGRRRRGSPLLVERDRLRLRAVGVLLSMLGVHLIKHLGGEVR